MILGLAIIAALLVSACGLHHWIVERRIRAEVRAIRESGLPASLEELGAWYPPPFSGPNAAPVNRKAFARLAEIAEAAFDEDEEDDWYEDAEDYSPEELARRFEEENEAYERAGELFEAGRVEEAAALLGVDTESESDQDGLPLVGCSAFLADGKPLTGELLERSQQFLYARRDVLEFLHKAAQRPGCRYTVDWVGDKDASEEDMALSLPRTRMDDYVDLQTGAKDGVELLCLEAVVLTANGRHQEASDALRDAARVTRSLDSLPMLMTHVVIINCGDTILDTVEYLATAYDLEPATLSSLRDAIQPLDDPDGLRRACIGERCFGLSMPDPPRDVRMPHDWPAAGVALVWAYDFLGFARADNLAAHRLKEKQVFAAQEEPSQRTNALEKVRADAEQIPPWRVWNTGDMDFLLSLSEADVKLLTRVAGTLKKRKL